MDRLTLWESARRALDFQGFEQLGNTAWWLPLWPGRPLPGGVIHSEAEACAFLWALAVVLKPELAVETGAHVGGATRALGCAVAFNGYGRVVSCDVDPECVARAQQLCAGLPVEVRCCPALELPELEAADLLFIDSSYESRAEELKRLKPGAIAVVHDTVLEQKVADAVAGYLRRINIWTPRGFAIIQGVT